MALSQFMSESEPLDSDEFSESEGADITWIQWWVSQKGNELLCEVEEDYVEDDFNLSGLAKDCENYSLALDMILDQDSLPELSNHDHDAVQADAELLYGLIHARYILSPSGLQIMREKYTAGEFGRCPRVYCNEALLLPVGESDKPGHKMVRLFCPCCKDIYWPQARHRKLDGAFFGRTFPHLFLMTFKDCRPKRYARLRSNTTTGCGRVYEPRIFGFRIHHSAFCSDTQADEEDEDDQDGSSEEGPSQVGASAGARGPVYVGEGVRGSEPGYYDQVRDFQEAARGGPGCSAVVVEVDENGEVLGGEDGGLLEYCAQELCSSGGDGDGGRERAGEVKCVSGSMEEQVKVSGGGKRVVGLMMGC